MSVTSKLFGIWAVNKTVTSATPLFLRLLAGMAAIAIGAMTAAVLIAMLLAGSVWLAYSQMLAIGIDPQSAMLIIGALLLALLGVLIRTVQEYYSRLRINSKALMNVHLFRGKRLTPLVDAFMDGYDSRTSVR